MTRFLLPILALAACTSAKPEDTASTDTADTADTTADDTDTGTAPDGAALYEQYCSSCHGSDGRGSYTGPDITGEVGRYSDQEIVGFILNGKREMPAIAVTEAEAYAVVEWIRAAF